MRANGKFDISMTPKEPSLISYSRITTGHMVFEKVFSGDIRGTSKGQMLSAVSTTPGSAGYVALEVFDVEIAGRQGQFTCQHYGRKTDSDSELILQVVPDSGAGELSGITGTMTIEIDNGEHFYAFDYEISEL